MAIFNKNVKKFKLVGFLCNKKKIQNVEEAKKRLDAGECIIAEGKVVYKGKEKSIKTMPLISIKTFEDILRLETNGIVFECAI